MTGGCRCSCQTDMNPVVQGVGGSLTLSCYVLSRDVRMTGHLLLPSSRHVGGWVTGGWRWGVSPALLGHLQGCQTDMNPVVQGRGGALK